ncbi:hypothetical protein [Methylophaga sp. OBS1]|jgi:hypothetical protein|uniref:hypothetical protein n=1 Tax=Methylophaga sp. OBS1 TaxID=2991933 RepID=UPI002257BDC1|nr:hypothetical protein [Methylophaga sp. OBS1]MCX4192266.1 hypothetical protein [Methylophaga sp. OBS1]
MKIFSVLLFCLSLSAAAIAAEPGAYEELKFLETFAGKSAEFVKTELGEPASVVKRENEGGTVEFWIYQDKVRQGTSEKVYRFTQIGFANGFVETLGHTNREINNQ